MLLDKFLDRDQDYASHYCEENIYRLALKYCTEVACNAHNAFAVFISNKLKQVPLWKQRLSDDPDEPVVWDYHVIFFVRDCEGGDRYIVDFDSAMGLSTPFLKYVKHAFRPERQFDNCYKQLFRVVPALDFINNFASDRSHMIDKEETELRSAAGKYNGSIVYMHPPPPWSAIRGSLADTTMNLDCYTSMEGSDDVKYGKVYSLDELLRANM